MEIMSYIFDQALILTPVLYIIGAIIKHTDVIPDKFIPLILLVVGVAGACGLMIPTGSTVADAVIQGVLVAGAAVYGNQLVKQLGKSE